MTADQLYQNICTKKSFLCVGLDTDINRIPKFLLDLEDPIFAFNKAIIDATKDLCIAYKPNIAFYEAMGVNGWIALQKTLEYIPDDIFTIADAKRGDIGNTTKKYADAFFKSMDFDAITVAPYMGEDSVSPFLDYEGKWSIILALTSNKGSYDFQRIVSNNKALYSSVIEISSQWGTKEQIMYVVGATRAEDLKEIRNIIPDHFLLVPGVGAQGGSLEEVVKNGMNSKCGLIVNSSRSIIYASNDEDFAEQARSKAMELQKQMAEFL